MSAEAGDVPILGPAAPTWNGGPCCAGPAGAAQGRALPMGGQGRKKRIDRPKIETYDILQIYHKRWNRGKGVLNDETADLCRPEGRGRRHPPAGAERVLQFGEGNFLRGFADDFIDRMNERAGFYGRVVVVPPASAGKAGRINAQQGLYQLCLRGKQNGAVVEERRMIRCISRALDVFADWDELLRTACQPELRFVISNTTEAGIVYDPACRWDDRPPASFPAKLTRLLWERWRSGGVGLGTAALRAHCG